MRVKIRILRCDAMCFNRELPMFQMGPEPPLLLILNMQMQVPPKGWYWSTKLYTATSNRTLILHKNNLTIYQGLVLCPTCVPEKVGISKKGVNQKGINQNWYFQKKNVHENKPAKQQSIMFINNCTW